VSPRRITVVTRELLGYVRVGGAGTATTYLAVALARMGHRVDVLYVGDLPGGPMTAEWAGLYEEAGIAIRLPPPSDEIVQPGRFTRLRAVEMALRGDVPEVVIAHDLTAPVYTALRLRQLGLAYEETLFVVFCHGTRLWAKEVARNERVSRDVLVEAALERASVELADVIVSPSAYLIAWMRDQGWQLPEQAVVIPYLTRSATAGEPPPEPAHTDGRVQRLTFFGRFEERKGVRPFVAGINSLEPELLEGIELDFLGRETPAWTPERIDGLLSEHAKRALRTVTFETGLDQPEALASLSRRGTLAVMPSLEDNSPNTVYECLERSIPFMASNVGGIPELVAPEDRPRVLFEPTAEGVAAGLRRALSAGDAPLPPRPAFDHSDSLRKWEAILATRPRRVAAASERPLVDVVVVHRQSAAELHRCLSALVAQSYGELSITVAVADPRGLASGDLPGRPLVVRSERLSIEGARQAGVGAGTAPWVVFLDEDDVASPELMATLVRAQAASGADVVTCGLELHDPDLGAELQFFLGEPRALGVLANCYGNTALIRRSLLSEMTSAWPADDPDWPLLARLSASGARIVSVPLPLVTRNTRPGTLEQHSADALQVVQTLERCLPPQLSSLARLTAGLAADMRQGGGR
jgi:glycosyltransferase involved in cell wall biosynthesis